MLPSHFYFLSLCINSINKPVARKSRRCGRQRISAISPAIVQSSLTGDIAVDARTVAISWIYAISDPNS
ncbi:unnamed protein product [Nezara viridula]|uniref:Uncharacterized protein n=1 Tax=Nezara viridula TaxID=85310 RepID=A0A9P0H2N5_NEZVI|nr:unnamed protein product [Nezara viridula]